MARSRLVYLVVQAVATERWLTGAQAIVGEGLGFRAMERAVDDA